MSFQDLERGSSSKPIARTLGSAPANSRGNAGGSGSGRGGGGDGGPMLPLYNTSHEEENSEGAREFKRKADALGIQIFKINANTQAIDKLVQISRRDQQDAGAAGAGAGAGQGAKGTDWTQRVHDISETTRALVKSTSADLKELSTLSLQLSDSASSSSSHGGSAQSQRKMTLAKLQRELEGALTSFQGAQRRSMERNKEAAELARREAARTAQQEHLQQQQQSSGKGQAAPGRSLGRAAGARDAKRSENQAALDQDVTPLIPVEPREDDDGGDGQQLQAQAQVQRSKGITQSELEFQESLIAEREAEIEEIENGIHELNEIFRDLGHIVQEQGGMIDNIEYNITSIATNTSGADRELVTAHEYQRKAGRRALCLMLIVGVVVAIVLLALLS